MIKLQLKKLCIFIFAACSLTACEMFELDNYDGPNASFNGGIRDVKTGELVETDIQDGSRMQLQELGYPTGLLTRVFKQNGEFRDDMMFAGSYSIDFNNSNFYPFKVEKVDIKKGDNKMDFEVTPYIRVKNTSIVKEGNTIKARFQLEPGKAEVRLSNIRLYVSTDIYVGEPFNAYNSNVLPVGNNFQQNFSGDNSIIDPSKTYELTIDIEANKSTIFKYSRDYYFRIGAKAANISGMGTIRRNYAPHTIIAL